MYLNNIHLKLARNLLGIGVREIGDLIHTSRTTVSKLENNIINLLDMKLGNRRNTILNEFFKKKGIIFSNAYSLRLNPSNFPHSSNSILTCYQIKGARIILNKTQADISKEFKIGISIIRRLENNQPANNTATVYLKRIFEQNGIKFPDKYSITFKSLVDIQTLK